VASVHIASDNRDCTVYNTQTRIQTHQDANIRHVYIRLAFLSMRLNAFEHIRKVKRTGRLCVLFKTNEWETLNQIMKRPNDEPGSESLSLSLHACLCFHKGSRPSQSQPNATRALTYRYTHLSWEALLPVATPPVGPFNSRLPAYCPTERLCPVVSTPAL
jgi:hypothetical protein